VIKENLEKEIKDKLLSMNQFLFPSGKSSRTNGKNDYRIPEDEF
jgi:hypothetical protein